MAKIFILEDDITRIDWFRKEFANHQLFIAMDADGGKQAVHCEKYDLMFLDHDLGGKVFVNSEDSNTGFQVAKEILKSRNAGTPVVIHSWNPIGTKNIASLLHGAIKKQFGNFKKQDFYFHEPDVQ